MEQSLAIDTVDFIAPSVAQTHGIARGLKNALPLSVLNEQIQAIKSRSTFSSNSAINGFKTQPTTVTQTVVQDVPRPKPFNFSTKSRNLIVVLDSQNPSTADSKFTHQMPGETSVDGPLEFLPESYDEPDHIVYASEEWNKNMGQPSRTCSREFEGYISPSTKTCSRQTSEHELRKSSDNLYDNNHHQLSNADALHRNSNDNFVHRNSVGKTSAWTRFKVQKRDIITIYEEDILVTLSEDNLTSDNQHAGGECDS